MNETLEAKVGPDAIDETIAANPVLSDIHRQLIRELPHLARIAQIPEHMVYEPLSKYCGEEEIEWLKGLRRHSQEDCYGLWYTKAPDVGVSVTTRMQALAAACLRNFIDARVIDAGELIKASVEDDLPEPTVLLIPSLGNSLEVENKGHRFRAERLAEILLRRRLAGQHTVIGVKDSSDYHLTLFGEDFVELLSTYKKI